MRIVKNQFCNGCKSDTHLVVTGVNDDSIFATCPLCRAEFDLINDGSQRVERKIITFRDSADIEFEVTEEAVLITPNIIAEHYPEEGVIFRVSPEPIGDIIDKSACRHIVIPIDQPDFEWLATASFLEVISKYAVETPVYNREEKLPVFMLRLRNRNRTKRIRNDLSMYRRINYRRRRFPNLHESIQPYKRNLYLR